MTTSALGVWTPGDSDDWDLTIDLAAMANSIDTVVLNTRARYEKSGATVGALGTGLFNGQTGWVTGTNPGLYTWSAATSSWDQIASRNTSWTPYAMAVGQDSNAAGAFKTVTLPAGRFSQPPRIYVSGLTAPPGMPIIQAVSTTSFQAGLFNAAGSAIAGTWNWQAVQMTATSASG